MHEGEKFLLKLYRELYAKDSVKHSGTISDNKYELINKYLKRLEKAEQVFSSENKEIIKYLKNRYYDKYLIKRENIKSNDETVKDKIIASQQESLDIWIDYLNKELNNYPMWIKYWVFQGMVKLGQYNRDTNAFSKRSKNTTSPFVELNKEALKSTMDLIIENVGNNKVDNKSLQKLIDNGSFSTLYAYSIKKQIEKNRYNTTDGIWKTYHTGEAKKLVQDIYEKNTSWCINNESITSNYLKNGPMLIYYTKDDKGNYTTPRVCIRKEDINIAEVKGILDNPGNLEYSMIDITIKKLDKLYNSETFKQIGEDLKRITEIDQKNKNNIPLSIEDLRFIYEIDRDIKNFTIYKDKRIEEIIATRNIKEDLAKVFNCMPEQISTNMREFGEKDIVAYYGTIFYEKEKSIRMPSAIIGNIYLDDNIKVKGFENVELITGSLVARCLLSAENFQSLRQINRNLDGTNMISALGFENLQKIGGKVKLPNLQFLEGLNSLKDTGDLYIRNAKTSNGLENLEIVRGNLDISNMIDLSRLENLKLVEKNVICYASNSLNELPNLKIKGDVHFYHMINIHNLFGKPRTRKR